MKAFLFLSLLICVSYCANLVFDVTCVSGPNACGSGGKYTLTQTAPTAQAPVANQNIVCVVGDTITFNFPTAEPRHPFDIEKNGATFPGAPASLPFSTAGSVVFPCDNNLLTNGPANYICIFHPSMTGTITAVTANQPTPPPTNGTVGPVIPTTTTATLDLTGYPLQIDLGKGMTFFWKPVTTSDTFLDFAIQAPTVGWVGIGFSRNDNFQMKGSDAFIGFVTPSAAPSTFLSGYVLTSKTIDGILSTPSDAGTFTFESASASQFNGVTTIAIRRRLGLGLNPILPTASGQMNAMIIASYCSDTTGVNYKHDVRIDYGRYVNLVTGQYEIAYRYAIPIRVAHGVLMGTAYAILFPLGLMVARYGKSPSGTWFKIHFFLQNYAFLVMLVGVIIGYTLPELQFASFTYHAGLGTAIFIFTIIQVVMGYARPHKEAGEPLSMGRKIFEFIHHWLGRSILIMAIAQIAAGILELGVAPFAYGIWVPFVGTFFIVSIILEVRERLKPKEEGGGLGYKLMI